MSGWPSAPGELGERQAVSLRRALARWREHRVEGGFRPGPSSPSATSAPSGWATSERGGEQPARSDRPRGGGGVELVDVELLRAGRTGLLDVVADMDGLLAHAVLGLHRPGDQLHVIGSVDEPALGMVEDDDGLAVVVDALHDAEAARLLLTVVAGDGVAAPGRLPGAQQLSPPAVSVLRDDAETTTIGVDRRVTLSVFPWLRHGPHPGMTLLAGLDDAHFNHLAAPLAFWRRAGRDLGVVQELLAGASGGWALALTSLRDMFAAGTSPDLAGGDFAPEAIALGTMAARMHIALDHAFGRQTGDVVAWSDDVEAILGNDAPRMLDAPTPGQPDLTLRQTLAALRDAGLHQPILRTHGDFHLGRTARTDHGWVLADCMPGGADPATGDVVFRSPLGDVADMCWSMRHAAVLAASERGPFNPRSRVGELAEAWDARNRRAFLAAYLATPGIGDLVPADRRVVRRIVAVFEAARAAREAPFLGPASSVSTS